MGNWRGRFCQFLDFAEKVLHHFLFSGGEGVYLADFRFEGFVKINLMIIGTGRRNMVHGFF